MLLVVSQRSPKKKVNLHTVVAPIMNARKSVRDVIVIEQPCNITKIQMGVSISALQSLI